MQPKHPLNGAWSIQHDELPMQFSAEDDCLHHSLPETLGLGQSNIFKLDRDIQYIETHYAPRRDLAVLSRINAPEPRMVVTLGLKGHSRYTPSRGESILFREGYTSVTTFNASEGAREYQADQTVTQLRFSIGKSLLAECFGAGALTAYFDRPETRLISHRPISAPGLAAAQLLMNCPVPNSAKALFRQGQALAILAAELSHLLDGEQTDAAKFGARDREIANLARDILYDEYQNPPSVSELARRAGTNQCKLKQLFHHYFDATPYGMLLEIRMTKARQLLKTNHYPIGMVAERVGYNHASNFSSAFLKYFGFPPKRIGRQD